MTSSTQQKLRDNRIARGQCGQCAEQRNKFDWLCDACAEKHRVKQRKIFCPNCAGAGFVGDGDIEVVCHVCVGDKRVTAKVAREYAAEMAVRS